MMLASAVLESVPGVRHGFFTRHGGVSTGIYSSLNCGPGSQDNADNVAANRRTALRQLDPEAEALCTLRQVHGNRVVTAERPWEQIPEADGIVTSAPGLAIGILAADCVPVLLACPESRVTGAAHAGWKGTTAGVLENTVDAMLALGARLENIIAAIGPHIGKNSYEVGPEFRERFLKEHDSNERFFTAAARTEFYLFDIGGYVAARLTSHGIRTVDDMERDTLTEKDLFFSYRRSVLNGEKDYGRQLSAICVTPF